MYTFVNILDHKFTSQFVKAPAYTERQNASEKKEGNRNNTRSTPLKADQNDLKYFFGFSRFKRFFLNHSRRMRLCAL